MNSWPFLNDNNDSNNNSNETDLIENGNNDDILCNVSHTIYH